jgi:transcriptional regulator with PAS, ATPase and Fis domain
MEENRSRQQAEPETQGGVLSALDRMIGRCSAIKELRETIIEVAEFGLPSPVLIQGESGTGKELVAKAIHENSPRKNKRFVAFNSAALSPTLLESELFGHVRGAFSGATDHKGKFEFANGGTLFLDEVGDMPEATQVELLRVLQELEITRVGSNETVSVDVRIVSATNRNLDDEIAKGTFREELFFRLAKVRLSVPPLRERGRDKIELAEHFLDQIARKLKQSVKTLDDAAEEVIMRYDWTRNNVRELETAIENAVRAAKKSRVITLEQLPAAIVHPGRGEEPKSPAPEDSRTGKGQSISIIDQTPSEPLCKQPVGPDGLEALGNALWKEVEECPDIVHADLNAPVGRSLVFNSFRHAAIVASRLTCDEKRPTHHFPRDTDAARWLRNSLSPQTQKSPDG